MKGNYLSLTAARVEARNRALSQDCKYHKHTCPIQIFKEDDNSYSVEIPFEPHSELIEAVDRSGRRFKLSIIKSQYGNTSFKWIPVKKTQTGNFTNDVWRFQSA